jgi:hypothetical protein
MVGVPCITYSALSTFDILEAAIENLRHRENMPSIRAVGFTAPNYDMQSEIAAERHPRALQTIIAWVHTIGVDAVIWTALGNNFIEKANGPFSVDAAVRYLECLDAQKLNGALNYIGQAPPEIQTPVRKAVATRWRSAFSLR